MYQEITAVSFKLITKTAELFFLYTSDCRGLNVLLNFRKMENIIWETRASSSSSERAYFFWRLDSKLLLETLKYVGFCFSECSEFSFVGRKLALALGPYREPQVLHSLLLTPLLAGSLW